MRYDKWYKFKTLWFSLLCNCYNIIWNNFHCCTIVIDRSYYITCNAQYIQCPHVWPNTPRSAWTQGNILETPVSIKLQIAIELWFLNIGVLFKHSVAFPFPQLVIGSQRDLNSYRVKPLEVQCRYDPFPLKLGVMSCQVHRFNWRYSMISRRGASWMDWGGESLK